MRPGQDAYVVQPRADIPRPACRVLRVFRRGRRRVCLVRFYDDGALYELPADLLSAAAGPAGSRRRPERGEGARR